MTKIHRCEAVVIGAGLAGLNAAVHLQDAGIDVRVVEAQDRVGGRVRSMRELGGNLEAGGTYIGAAYRRVIAAASRHDVRLIDVTPSLKFFREQDLVLDGEIIRQSEWPAHPANSFPDQDKALMPWSFSRMLSARQNPLEEPGNWLDPEQAVHDVSMYEWMRRLGLNDRTIRLGYGMNVSYGEDAHDISALQLLFRAAFSRAQADTPVPATNLADGSSAPYLAPKTSSARARGYTAADGVQRIPEAMAESLPHPAHYGRLARRIEDDGRQVTVRCEGGAEYRAAYAVCALPFTVLRNIAFDPPMDGYQREAVANIPSQSMTQLYFAHKSEFWQEDGIAPSLFTDTAAGMFSAIRNGSDPTEVTGFSAWVMGRNAARLDALPPDAAGARVIREIETVRPAARGQLEFIGRQSWGADPFARGAWAYFRPGQITRYAAAMGAPHGRIRFCGEHLAVA
ncbi:MAG: NAD(P)/FAD-dependent oxidoreductase, partial [Rhodospirillaceae bacterium]|nr:NAD(P)/FAD-dependent oxidoreductase [Rhodospirillaceae bacterium]